QRNGKEPVEARVAVAPGAEQNLFAVRSPAHDFINAWMIGEALWHSAFRRHDVNVNVAVVIAGEGDHAPIRREDRVALGAASAGEQMSFTAVARDDPQIARVSKCNVRLGKRWRLQQQRATGLRRNGQEKSAEQE